MACVFASFGMPYGRVIDYDDWVGLVLNLEMVSHRGSVEVARGVSAAGSATPLSESWAEALAVDGAEVDEILFRLNAARHLARAKNKLGFS